MLVQAVLEANMAINDTALHTNMVDNLQTS